MDKRFMAQWRGLASQYHHHAVGPGSGHRHQVLPSQARPTGGSAQRSQGHCEGVRPRVGRAGLELLEGQPLVEGVGACCRCWSGPAQRGLEDQHRHPHRLPRRARRGCSAQGRLRGLPHTRHPGAERQGRRERGRRDEVRLPHRRGGRGPGREDALDETYDPIHWERTIQRLEKGLSGLEDWWLGNGEMFARGELRDTMGGEAEAAQRVIEATERAAVMGETFKAAVTAAKPTRPVSKRPPTAGNAAVEREVARRMAAVKQSVQ